MEIPGGHLGVDGAGRQRRHRRVEAPSDDLPVTAQRGRTSRAGGELHERHTWRERRDVQLPGVVGPMADHDTVAPAQQREVRPTDGFDVADARRQLWSVEWAGGTDREVAVAAQGEG